MGANARAYLQDTFPRLVVEIHAVSGREPSADALGHLRAKVGEVAAKPAGIDVRRGEIPASSDRYTVEELKALERRHRRTSTGGDTASVHALYLNGSFAPDEGVLAIVFSASSIAVFPDQIARAATPVVSASRIERSVLLHEMGHLMGLINLGYHSPRDREDPDHPHHSRNRNSVMYWAVETNLVLTILSGPPPDDFDADDRADLADLRAGRL